MAAAQMILRCLGHSTAAKGEPTDVETCIRRGEREMHREVEEFGRWIAGLWRAEPRSVIFAVAEIGGVPTRVGVSIVIPLTDAMFAGITTGEIGDPDLKFSDVPTSSRHLYMHSVADIPELPGLSTKAKTRAQLHTVMYQSAYFTRALKLLRPVVVSLFANPLTELRLRQHGYVDTGFCLKGTDKHVAVLRHPKDGGPRSMKPHILYRTVMLVLWIYRAANYKRWKREDPLRP